MEGCYLTAHWKFANEIQNIALEIIVEQQKWACHSICLVFSPLAHNRFLFIIKKTSNSEEFSANMNIAKKHFSWNVVVSVQQLNDPTEKKIPTAQVRVLAKQKHRDVCTDNN